MHTDAISYIDSCRREIEDVFSIVDSAKVEASAIAKSCVILMIYNMVEGAFSTLLQDFFDFLKQNQEMLNTNPSLKNMILKYHGNFIGNDLKRLENFHDTDLIQIPDYSDYKQNVKLFSGNLDAKEIRAITKKFEITYAGSQSDEKLLYVKNIRNKLAHGEQKYSEACRNKTKQEILDCINASCNYMKRVVNAFLLKYT